MAKNGAKIIEEVKLLKGFVVDLHNLETLGA